MSLPASKSISNRVLIIHALADSDMPVENLADCDDTKSMLEVLSSDGTCFHVGHAGISYAFPDCFLCPGCGKWEFNRIRAHETNGP